MYVATTKDVGYELGSVTLEIWGAPYTEFDITNTL